MSQSNLALAPAPAPAPTPTLRTELAGALARAADLNARIEKVVGALTRCRKVGEAVVGARTALESLQTAQTEAVRQWAARGADGDPPREDEAAFNAARDALARAETDSAAAAAGKTVIDEELQRLYAQRNAAGSEVAALVRRVELEEVDRIFGEIAELERRRADRRADAVGLFGLFSQAGMRGDGSALKLANELRVKLAKDPPEFTDAEFRAAQAAWLRFRERLSTNDPQCHFVAASIEE